MLCHWATCITEMVIALLICILQTGFISLHIVTAIGNLFRCTTDMYHTYYVIYSCFLCGILPSNALYLYLTHMLGDMPYINGNSSPNVQMHATGLIFILKYCHSHLESIKMSNRSVTYILGKLYLFL